MTNNQKKFVYDLFYHKYDMIGKFNYIIWTVEHFVKWIEEGEKKEDEA